MKKFRDLPIRTKLFASFGVMILLLVIIAATAYLSVASIQENNKNIYQNDFTNVVDILEIQASNAANRDAVISMIMETNKSAIEQQNMEISQRNSINDDTLQNLISRNKNDPVLQPKLLAFYELRNQYVDTRDNEQIPLILAGKKDDATRIAQGIQKQQLAKIDPIVNEIVNITEQRVADSSRLSDQLATQMNTIIVIIFIISLIAGIGMAIFITQTIAGPLNTLAQTANQIAAGDLTIKISPETREDEIGVLTDSFRRMVIGLREVHTELSEGINVLASSSSEILATTTEIASGAAETAAAVSETTTTVEEVKQTSELSSQKARVVADNAQQASAVALSGQKAVDDVVGGMQRVQEQMESIAENVVHLAEKSQEIGEIIRTVNDISEQSNILAVNASIEAAKAGEEGKGFNVVAQEIRTLADQSKQATAQVRTILTDIQRGVSAAVMATEQGNRTVSEGMKQSNEAGESIKLLTKTISESAKAATQIAASSQQQTVGISQIVQSMENIRQASQQNMTGTKQAEETAKVLHDLGQKLRQIASRYRL